MNTIPLHCRACGNFGSRDCSEKSERSTDCTSFLSWSEHWTQEMAAIDKALRNTYIAAACFAVIAMATVVLPTAFH